MCHVRTRLPLFRIKFRNKLVYIVIILAVLLLWIIASQYNNRTNSGNIQSSSEITLHDRMKLRRAMIKQQYCTNHGNTSSTRLDLNLDSFVRPQFLPNYKNPCFVQNITTGTKTRETFGCLPYFIVAGFPKTGTTDLWSRFMNHPDMVLHHVKEPMYFNKGKTNADCNIDIGHVTDSDQSDGESPQLFIAENLDPAQDHDDSGNQSSGSHQPPITLCSPNTAGNQPSVSSDGLDHGNQGFLDLSMTGGNSSERLRSALTTEASSKETEIVQKFISYDSKSVNEEHDSNKASGHVAENKPDPTDVDFVMKVVDGKVGIWTNIKLDAGKNIGPLMVTQLNSPTKLSNTVALARTPRETCDLESTSPDLDWGLADTFGSQDGQWSEWTGWTDCCTDDESKQSSTRYRLCDNPPKLGDGLDCTGEISQSRDCEADICPVDGVVGLWSDWSDCTCEDFGTGSKGTKTRTRTCEGTANRGEYCHVVLDQFAGCKGNCPADGEPVDGTKTEWSAWTDCFCNGIASGSTGVKTRSRSCVNTANGGKTCGGSFNEVDACNGDCDYND